VPSLKTVPRSSACFKNAGSAPKKRVKNSATRKK
jgi:hypothetical protein